jgi:hypothetical protein
MGEKAAHGNNRSHQSRHYGSAVEEFAGDWEDCHPVSLLLRRSRVVRTLQQVCVEFETKRCGTVAYAQRTLTAGAYAGN